jgi:hypothetical protein
MHANTDAAPASCMQAATCLSGLRAAICAEDISQLGIATLLLDKAVTMRGAQLSAILPAAVGLQALCLASRPGHNDKGSSGGRPTSPAKALHSLSISMLRASSAAQAAARQLLQQEPDGQVECDHISSDSHHATWPTPRVPAAQRTVITPMRLLSIACHA